MPDGPGSVVNQGSIIGTNDYGIEIGGAGSITNDLLVEGANGIDTSGAGTLTNVGIIIATNGSGVFFGDGGSVTNYAGKSIRGTSGGVIITSATGTLVNSGSIVASAGEAAELASGGTVSNLATAALIDGGYYGVWMPDGPGSVVNHGSIIGTNDYGIEIGGAGNITNNLLVEGANGIDTSGAGTLTNAGSVIATNGSGVFFGDGGSVTNDAGKSIKGTSGGVIITSATGKVINDGTIAASSGDAVELASGGTVSNATASTVIDGDYYGVWMPDGSGSVTNDGTIIGTNDYGIEIGGNGANVTNSGLIKGATGVDFAGTGGTLTTSGTIVGTGGVAVDIGTQNKLVAEAGATFVGKVLDPGGSDSLELAGAAPGSLAGLGSTIAGFGAVGVDAGSDWTLRGSSTAEDFLVDGTATVAAGGRLDIATIDPASTGLIALAAGAALEVGQAAARQTRMTFLGGNTLVIDHATAFGINVGSTAYAGPLLQGFGPGDTIDLKDIAPVGLQLVRAGAPGVLEIASAGAVKASLLFGASELAGLSLHLAGDGHGGTRLTAG
jgi:hypothetical protein